MNIRSLLIVSWFICGIHQAFAAQDATCPPASASSSNFQTVLGAVQAVGQSSVAASSKTPLEKTIYFPHAKEQGWYEKFDLDKIRKDQIFHDPQLLVSYSTCAGAKVTPLPPRVSNRRSAKVDEMSGASRARNCFYASAEASLAEFQALGSSICPENCTPILSMTQQASVLFKEKNSSTPFYQCWYQNVVGCHDPKIPPQRVARQYSPQYYAQPQDPLRDSYRSLRMLNEMMRLNDRYERWLERGDSDDESGGGRGRSRGRSPAIPEGFAPSLESIIGDSEILPPSDLGSQLDDLSLGQ